MSSSKRPTKRPSRAGAPASNVSPDNPANAPDGPDVPDVRIGRHRLSWQRGGSSFYATWWDAEARRTRRASLGTADPERAVLALAEFALTHDQPRNAPPAEVFLSQVLAPYLEQHSDHRPSAVQARIAAGQLLDFWGDAATLADLTAARQRAFIRHQRAQRGHAPSTISRTLSVLSAALGRARKEGLVIAVPQVLLSPHEIAELLDAPAKEQERRLTVAEIARFLDAIPARSEHLWRFAVLAIHTLARPDALTDLRPAQLDTELGLLRLNPPGRRQTKKRRPTIPVTEGLARWLALWEARADRYVYVGGATTAAGAARSQPRPVANLKRGVRAAAIGAGLQAEHEWDDTRTVTPYTLRRSMARLLRARGVPMADTAAWLGHSLRGMATTEEYADVDPAFLQTPRAAIDALAVEIDGLMAGPRRLDATKGRPKQTAASDPSSAAVPKNQTRSGS